MTFWSKAARVFGRSACAEDSITGPKVLSRAGIDSEKKLLGAVARKGASAETLAVVGWLLPRWPGAAARKTFLEAERVLLFHPDAAVRAEAAVGMGLFRLEAAPEVLSAALDDSDDDVRVRVIASLGLHGDVSTLAKLLALLGPREPVAIRVAVVEALCGFPAPSVEPLLETALRDRSPAVRAAAASSKRELKRPRARRDQRLR